MKRWSSTVNLYSGISLLLIALLLTEIFNERTHYYVAPAISGEVLFLVVCVCYDVCTATLFVSNIIGKWLAVAYSGGMARPPSWSDRKFLDNFALFLQASFRDWTVTSVSQGFKWSSVFSVSQKLHQNAPKLIILGTRCFPRKGPSL